MRRNLTLVEATTTRAECTVCNYVLADQTALVSHIIEYERNILANFTTSERKVSSLSLPPPIVRKHNATRAGDSVVYKQSEGEGKVRVLLFFSCVTEIVYS